MVGMHALNVHCWQDFVVVVVCVCVHRFIGCRWCTARRKSCFRGNFA